MPLPVRTTLLAAAALAAVAFAAVRITSAAEHRTFVREPEPPHREVTPAQAAATLARLRPPPGFRQIRDCRFAVGNFAAECFLSPSALALDARTVLRISATWPARAGGDPLLDGCFLPHHFKGGLVLRHCNWELELGPELVAVSSDSLHAPPGPPRTQIAAKALRTWRRGTEIKLIALGHWPHGKAPKGAPSL